MESIGSKRRTHRLRRHRRIRKSLEGTPARPRLAVRRSLRHVYAQVIDDVGAQTLVAVSTLDKGARDEINGAESRMERSKLLGRLLAERLLAKGIKAVAFDRGGHLYHGHVKALADGAREAGLDF